MKPATRLFRFVVLVIPFQLLFYVGYAPRPDSVRPASQNPSPMQESTRRHERIPDKPLEGIRFTLEGILPKPVDVFVPEKSMRAESFLLLLHFHGAAFVTNHAAAQFNGNVIAATINLGAGSSVYGNGFADSTTFGNLVAAIQDSVGFRLGKTVQLDRIVLTSFSAGYGAVRQILSIRKNYESVRGVLLLDGIHAGYVPDRRVLAEGGQIDTTDLEVFLKLAEDASGQNSTKRFLITHSEIFPGTFVSTTESADYLIRQLKMKREPVLQWGPLGMQQLSRAARNHFSILGFAGNSAQDHVDHLHALFYFLDMVENL